MELSKGVLLALVVVTAEASLTVDDNNHLPCTSVEDPRLKTTCELSDKLDDNYRCWVTAGLTCRGRTFVGQGSVCQHRHTASLIYKCQAGRWVDRDGDEREITHDRTKRWGFRVRLRFIRLRFSRLVCGVSRWFRRRSCSSPSPPPPPANKPPYFTDCGSRDIQVTALPNQLTARVSWTAPRASDPNGGTPSVTQVSGPVPGSVFREGTRTIIYKTRDSGGLSAYCYFSVTVSVTECPRAPYVQHGTQSCSGARHNVYGSVCSHTCNTGYELNGQSAVTCQSGGAWTSSFPTCQGVACGVPTPVTNGQWVCPQGYSYPQLCVLQCEDGYRASGSPFMSCAASRQWSQAGSCQDVEAPVFSNGCPANQQLYSGPLESPVSVTWLDPVVSDNSGQAVTLTSSVAKGSSLGPGIHVVRLTATDQSGNRASCNFIISVQVKRCLAFVPPPNSHVTCTRGYMEGSECTVACNPGHQLQGQATLRCMNTEVWSYPTPVCDAITCPTPQVDYGSSVCPGGLQFKSVCTLSCEAGFVRGGLSSVQCLDNATWSGQGTCLDVQPPVFVNTPCQSNIEVYANPPGVPNFVKWTDPPVQDNSRRPVTLTSDVKSNTSFPVGVTYVTYTATDEAGNTQTCRFPVTVKTLSCGVPDLEPANRNRTLMTYTCPDGYVYGASCTVNCTHGYPLIGSNSITCERDDSTFPPTVRWDWPGPSSVPPVCSDNVCPDLDPPENGALACFLASFGWDCLMSCQASWDVPAVTDGHFYCTNSNGFWIPGTVPDCVVRLLPGRVRLQAEVFYFTSSCNASLDELRQNFITRLSNSTWKDACVNVPTCTAENVKVFCGPLSGRRRRSLGHRGRRSTHYVLVSFEVVMDYAEGADTKEEAFQNYSTVRTSLYDRMKEDADNGLYNLGDLSTNQYNIQYPIMTIDCPPGTFFTPTSSTSAFSCVGCSKGHFLPDTETSCQPCPVGSYTDLDNATSCTPCPPGWTTPTTASQHVSQCQELCRPGSMSDDGFAPCQPCLSGYHQSRDGAVTCDLCPPGTWTSGSGATGPQDCVAADVVLSSSSVSGAVARGWSSLAVWVWVNLKSNSSVHLNLTFDVPGGATAGLLLYTDGADITNSPMTSSTPRRLEVDSWRRILYTVDPPNSVLNVYLQNTTVLTSSANVTNSSLLLNIYSPDKGVLVSGVRAEGRQVSQGEITTGSSSCMGNNSENLMTWTSLPTSVFVPSSCDAVDECLSSPCGSHGSCQNQVAGFRCQCTDGWSGPTCSLPPDSCYLHRCQNGATCLPGTDNYTCLCDHYHTGGWCQLDIVEGGWGEWSTRTDCSATCEGQQQRQRRCDNPAPSNGGSNCTGSNTEMLPCGDTLCPVNGGWGQWSSWTVCSTTCEGGEKTRQRQCDNPAPQGAGLECEGASSEALACATGPCPVHGGWADWSGWAPCSVTCGEGQRSRDRSCDNPVPAIGGDLCRGSSNETATCNPGPCPECVQLNRPQGAFLACTEELSPYLKTCNLTCLPGFMSPTPFPLYTCGEKTGYVWNHQRDHQLLPDLPSCTRPRTIGGLTISRTVPMNTGCDTTSSSVQEKVQDKLRLSLPCATRSVCSTELNSSCPTSTRRKRSSDLLQINLRIHFDFGNSTDIDQNNTEAYTLYEEQLSSVEETFLKVTNDTASLFTVIVDGRIITPDVTNADSGVTVYCPVGSTVVDMLCVQCPAGSKEVDGECVLCPLGQYQQQTGSSTCQPCPEGRSWDVMGATDVTQCQFDYSSAREESDDTPDDDNAEDDSSNVGLIVGVVCGTALLIAIIAAFVIIKVKQNSSRNDRTSVPSIGFKHRVFPSVPLSPYSSVPPSYWEAIGRATPSDLELTFMGKELPPVD